MDARGQRRDVAPPAEEADTIRHARPLRGLLQGLLFRPFAAEPQHGARDARQGIEQHVEALVRMQPPEREQHRGVGCRVEAAAIRRRRRRRVDEVGQVPGILLRPAAADDVVADIRGIADQVVAVAVVFQIVVTAHARRHHVPAGPAESRGAAHPGELDVGRELLGGPAKRAPCGKIEHAAERKLDRCDSVGAEQRRPLAVLPDDGALRDPGARQGRDEPVEKGFRAAVRGARHHLHHARQSSSSRAFR